ncbi:MAG TPA: YihY/virulence factor BrkB family protein [Solirubrobacterales bacterium]|nr:YihY/virulence factor BrkB family protein [Solirubrobacterales bacterium]
MAEHDDDSDDKGLTDPVREDVEPRRADYAPEGVEHKTGTWPLLKRTFKEFQEDNITDWAAALTYYSLLSLFPALIAMVAIVGLVFDPQEVTTAITDVVEQMGPSSAADTFSGPIESVTSSQSASGILLIVGVLISLNAASGYVGAFIRASNIIWETPEGRGFFKLRPLQIGVTLAMILMLVVVAMGLILTGPLVEAVGSAIGVGDTAVTVWDVAKWPFLLAIVVLMFGVLYYASPNVTPPGFRWITLGSLVAVAVWLIASAAFAFYVANFGSYDKTYGTLGGVVALLVWFWITNVALLFGMQLNSERERERELKAGIPRADKEIQLEPRDEPDYKQTT